MEETKSFNDLLFQAILERQQMFDSVLLPKLQEEFRISQSAAKTIQTVLLKKGILHDNPYKYDSKITEIQIPPDDSFTDTERAGVIGTRLAHYEAMLDYMHNYYQFTCDFLTTDRINKLIELSHTFAWESFTTSSSKPNTKGLADLVNNVRNGTDPMSISIINDSISQLSRASVSITKSLKGLTDFHKERYKIAVRKLVMPSVVIDQASLSSGTSASLKEIKRSFSQNMKDQPFYTELIEEILKEEYSPDHEVLQKELLVRLTSLKQDLKKNVQEDNPKTFLMDGIKAVGATGTQLDEIIAKLIENEHLMNSIEKGFMQKLAEFFRKAFNKPEVHQDMIINTLDPLTQTSKRETIVFTSFIEEIKHRARIYNGFTVRSSPAYQKIEQMQEQQILDLLTRHVAELNVTLKQCAGLDDFFKQNAPPEIRNNIRGVKVDISAIRNNLVKANQCRAEYSSQVEEQQQLKKLGITNA